MQYTTKVAQVSSKSIRIRKSTGEAAILMLLGGLGVFAVAYSQLNLPLENPFGAGVGPRLFPQLAGTIMILMSMYLLGLLGWRRQRGTLDDEVMELNVGDHIRVASVLVFVLGYMAVFQALGFLAATAGFLFLSFVTLGFRRYVLAVAIAVLATIAIYLVFGIGLGMSLPAPILDNLGGMV